MCVVALALDRHPRWRIVLAANRDEFHERPSAPLARWEGDDAQIIGGRDLQSGGGWLGVSDQGRIAVITNIRTGSAPDPAKASRGALVADYLRGHGQPGPETLENFNPLSLLTIGPEGAQLTANHPAPFAEALHPGIHGLSNGLPGESWPRKDRLLQAFTDCLAGEGDLSLALLTLLASESIDDSIFIRNSAYGTRCSTVVLVDREGSGTICERRFGADGLTLGKTIIAFTMPC
jgi:uncharacterized protein with NRDE domain